MVKIDMEMPLECHECPFQLKFKDGEADAFYMRRCVIENRRIEYPRPEWCPLRECEDTNGLIHKIGSIITVHGQSDRRFHLGEIIRYAPSEVEKILLEHVDELK